VKNESCQKNLKKQGKDSEMPDKKLNSSIKAEIKEEKQSLNDPSQSIALLSLILLELEGDSLKISVNMTQEASLLKNEEEKSAKMMKKVPIIVFNSPVDEQIQRISPSPEKLESKANTDKFSRFSVFEVC